MARNWMAQDPTSAHPRLSPRSLDSDGNHRARGHLWKCLFGAASADAARISVDHFSAVFRASTGYGPTDYYQRRRVHRACQLLLNPVPSITEIATELGFSDAPHFCRVFKRYRTMTPTDYRRLYRV